MEKFSELLQNQLLFWSLISCISAQFLKVIFNYVSNGDFKFSVIFETGGMPSSHSALISALTAGLGWEMGFDNPIFAFSVGISLIVMYDASGVRRSAGLNASEINKISQKFDLNPMTELKEKLGHTKLEVLVGSIIGPLITIPALYFLGSPLDLFKSFIK